jgi:hypothetical protein
MYFLDNFWCCPPNISDQCPIFLAATHYLLLYTFHYLSEVALCECDASWLHRCSLRIGLFFRWGSRELERCYAEDSELAYYYFASNWTGQYKHTFSIFYPLAQTSCHQVLYRSPNCEDFQLPSDLETSTFESATLPVTSLGRALVWACFCFLNDWKLLGKLSWEGFYSFALHSCPSAYP